MLKNNILTQTALGILTAAVMTSTGFAQEGAKRRQLA